MHKKLILFFLLFIICRVNAQVNLDYYLPVIDYNKEIPVPGDFLGYQVGEWHINHSMLVSYMEIIAQRSDRAIIYEYARSYEHRPLVHLVITSEENHKRLEEIRLNHLALADPEISGDIDIGGMPAIIKLGYGVHGNEQSAHNSSMLVAYYLAAGQSEKIDDLLENLVIILDPSLNPDGQDRFASWVNRYKSHTLNTDPNSIEFSEVWPGSRTNHYWFDLNRDWLPVQHPESYGRVKAYHRWKPVISVDHHEMGTNTTFFFSPGPPERLNPRIPQQADDLTLEVGKYSARALDETGQMYFTQDIFDDFYFGMGYTYPNINGSVGMLFEQASSRGHRVETIHGIMDFSETIKNQVVVSLATIDAGLNMRERLLDHLRWFYASAIEEASMETTAAFIFGDPLDNGKNYHLLDILSVHQIEVRDITQSITIDGETFFPGSAWLVPLEQPQYRLVMSLFEKVLEFGDSTFYDISTWTKPLAFNIPYGTITYAQLNTLQGDKVADPARPEGYLAGGISNNFYIFPWDDYYSPKALYFLQNNGLRTKVATSPFIAGNDGGEQVKFDYGSILIPVRTQDHDPEKIHELVMQAAEISGITIHSVETSFATEGIHLGSNSFASLNKPEILMLIGPGTSFREAGEAWHLLDQRYNIPVTMVDSERINNMELGRYNTLVLVSGDYNDINEDGKASLIRWLRSGGTIVAIGPANQWLVRNDMASIDFVSLNSPENPVSLPYNVRAKFNGARRLFGSIFEGKLDLTHPVAYGYKRESLPYYITGTLAMQPDSSPFANPLLFAEDALLSGYAWKPYQERISNSAGIIINVTGRGRIISFTNNPNFRAFSFGTNKLFANALFFGSVMDR
jgi:hypothetical protein